MSLTSLFQVSPASGVPIYRQLMDQVRTLIASGRLTPGIRLPTVRELAETLQINPMTVSKAWSLLERDGIVEHLRGHGMVVRQPVSSVPTQVRQEALLPLARELVASAWQLSLSREQVLELLEPLFTALEAGHPPESAPEVSTASQEKSVKSHRGGGS